MPRVMTIWLPRWPVQRRLVERPEWRKRPVFICRREGRGLMTVVSWAWAEPPRRRRAAIGPGMPLAEAMAVLALAHGSQACHAAEIDADDPAADALALEQLARACRRFAPVVGIEAVPPAPGRAAAVAAGPECLLLDVTATAGFFGGEAALARTAAWTLAARGLHARTAIADTPAAAWAAAHHTDLVARQTLRATDRLAAGSASTGMAGRMADSGHRRWAVVPPGAQRLARGEEAVLAALPLSALRLEPAAGDMLREVGIDTIGGVLRLSAKSLAARFPASVSRRLAEFTGTRPEPIMPPRGEELPQAAHDFELPLSLASVDEAMLAGLLEELVGRCVAPLVARGEGIVSLQVRLEPAAAATTVAPTTAAPTVIDVGLFRPSASPRHVVELVRLRMGRMRLPREIVAVAVDVLAAGPVECRQRPLFDVAPEGMAGATAASQAADVAILLDRLAGRLGRPAVFEPRPVADAQPEHAWIASPPGPPTATHRGAARSGGTSPRGAGRQPAPAAGNRRPIPAAAGRRPIWMPPRPVPLEPLQAAMLAVVPDGPPARFRLGGVVHRITQAHGPERIETAWWRGPTVRRDYYVVETESGARFWLFRRLGRAARGSRGSNWYLHGVFA
jgi:protein ImuB